MLIDSRSYSSGTGYRWGFNGKENDNEVKGIGNSLDFGARIYDSRLGRWLSTDALANKYPDFSSFVFALNTPIQAKDPDGNVVIFINGQHTGSGGTASYWGEYDTKVMTALGDESARYVDGALGGWKNTGKEALKGAEVGGIIGWGGAIIGAAIKVAVSSNVNMKVRKTAGEAQGLKDASDIYANLKEGESVKIISHSMGTAYARGYVKGLNKWAKENGKTFNIEYELDVNSFQGADLPIDKNAVKISQNKTGGLDGGKSITEAAKGNSVPTVAPVPNAYNTSTKEDATKGHAIDKMSTDGIPKLGNGGVKNSVELGSNNKGKR